MANLDTTTGPQAGNNDIAIVGMAAHLPDARTLAQYWSNLRDGVESIRHLSEEELIAAGERPEKMRHRNYVPASSILEGFDEFDAEFFGLSPKEAAIMDPQHRRFLEVTWEALENAGHPPEKFPGPIGVFAGCGMGSYFYFNICSNRDLVDNVGMFLLRHTGNDKDFLSTRVSHIFDLKGPSINLQTACSTSLVALHYACRSLLSGECDMALAGGVTIELPHARGYIFEEGEILSPDGHCHAFDHRAQGTVFGSGAGAVVLRRLEDAIADGDHIWAVVKGSAVNNDGAAKAGYLAPSVEGQAAAIAAAHAAAGVTADTIDYIECHGTGTYLGDPIEVAALTQAFRETTDETGFCGIGSVKTNIGHLDTAAGVASLIKTSLSLYNRQIPPSLGYEAPNPSIDFDTSPFRVNAALNDWVSHKGPRRGAVNSLGVGGTNAHAILEEAPPRVPSEESDWPFHLLVVSGRTRAALDANAAALAGYLRDNPDQPLADIAYTLKEGRRAFQKRRVLVAETHEEAIALLESNDPRRVFNHEPVGDAPEVVFMFPGGGAQYAGMARDLYETEPVFQEWMDRGLGILQPRLDYDIRALWLPEPEGQEAAAEKLKQPSVQLPLIMITEYALAQLWMSWGVSPAALVGHSMGENTAACLSGVMSFEDCIGLVHLRGRLFDTVPAGGMLSVPLSEADLRPLMGADLDMASVNAPGLCVVSGPQAALDALEARLAAQDVECQRIQIDIAAHSRMLEPILKQFGDYLRSITLSAPRIPIVSNRSGTWLSEAEATDPDYWVRHLRNSVNFADCMATLMQEPERVYLEVGPGKALGSLAQANGVPAQQVMSALRHPEQDIADDVYFIGILGRLWATGVDVDWTPIWGTARRNRLPLPGYAFQRQRYFIERDKSRHAAEAPALARIEDLEDWGWAPVWRPRLPDFLPDADGRPVLEEPCTWLIFVDEAGLGSRLVARLRDGGHRVVEVRAGDAFARAGEMGYTLSPERGREGYDQLVQDLVARGLAPARIAHFWLVTRDESFRPGSSFFHRNQEQGFYSLMFLAQAIADENLPRPIQITAVTSGAAQLHGEALPYPDKATVMGPVRVIPREMPGVSCTLVDVALPRPDARLFGGKALRALTDPFAGRRAMGGALDRLAEQLLEDLLAEPPANGSEARIAAWRGDRRFALEFRPVALKAPADKAPLEELREGGVCLLTGGFGGIGLTIAERLVRERGARVVLLARSELPAPAERAAWLRAHDPFDPVSRRILAVQYLEEIGGEVMTVAADVCNVEDMRAVIENVRARFGGLHAVIHAAGMVDDGPLMTKSAASIEEVFAPKIHGTQILDNLFADGDLDLMVLFSSTSTVTAPIGQIDYVAANEYLNAYAKSRQGGRTRVVAINWGIWNEVGMAADAVSARLGRRPPAPVRDAGQPMLDKASFDARGNRVFSTELRVADRWVLDGHRTRAGDALLPGTASLELVAEALAAQGETGPFEINDLYFFRPFHVADDRPREMRVRLARSDEGYAFELRGDCLLNGRRGHELCAQASIALGAQKGGGTATVDLAAVRARCTVRSLPDDPGGIRSPQEEHLDFGPRWRVLRSLDLGKDEGIARLKLPDAFAGEPDAGWLLHPALLDLATGWAMDLIAGYEPSHLWVPVSYRRVRVHRPLPAEVFSWVRNAGDNRADAPFATFDITLCDAKGNICAEVEGFSIRRLDSSEGFARTTPPDPRAVEFDEDGGAAEGAQPLSPAEERLMHNLSQGILPAEGAEAFGRALTLGRAQIVVSSLDLNVLAQQAGEGMASEESAGQKFERPKLDNDYVAPRNDIERTLVGFWEELLGVDQVGVEDSFFDLGGHSLIAVRLFSMIKKAYRTEFPISVLFEAPTIARCAALIAERVGGATDSAGEAAGQGAAPKAPARRFTHLVAMHEGEGGPGQPFFLVAGMFGNVLNLRHLAHLLGANRPFYGLQARGLYGDEAPHATLAEAATDYIAELRQVQPHGPYMLGGFSGGGLTAYEMAHQLEAAGESVSLLVMLDTPLPVAPPLSRADRMLIKAQEIRQGGPRYFGEWVRNRAAWEMGRLRARFEEPEPLPENQFHNAAIEAAFRGALPLYDLRGWNGPMVLFRPPLDRRWKVGGGRWVNAERDYVFEDNDWTRLVPGVEVIEVPGNHDSMVLEPNVRVLAARMKACIERAEAGTAEVPPAAEAAE